MMSLNAELGRHEDSGLLEDSVSWSQPETVVVLLRIFKKNCTKEI